jgi:hypothetical protein
LRRSPGHTVGNRVAMSLDAALRVLGVDLPSRASVCPLGSFSEGPARRQATGTGACLPGRSLMIRLRDSGTRHAAHKLPEFATFYDPGTITVTRVIRP